jgi:hypothetical protein
LGARVLDSDRQLKLSSPPSRLDDEVLAKLTVQDRSLGVEDGLKSGGWDFKSGR